MLRTLFILLVILFSSHSYGAKGVAKVLKMRGEISFKNSISGESGMLKKGMWLKEKTIISSEKKSFARILYIDKSTMTIGPNSQIEIKQFPKNKAGIINLVKGKIRSQVTKNYMKMKKDQSKLFITTKNAAMGVRGTDFMVAFSESDNITSLVTYSGAVAMSKLSSDFEQFGNQRALETQVSSDEAVMVKRGEFSKASEQDAKSSAPVKIDQLQLKDMKYDSDLQGKDEKTVKKSIVPPGINAATVENKSEALKEFVKEVGGDLVTETQSTLQPKPQVLTIAGDPTPITIEPAVVKVLDDAVVEETVLLLPPPPPPELPDLQDIYELINVNIHVTLE